MSRPPHARLAVLDAFEHLLLTQGERTATMDAVAREAGVSKGGLLYHFPSKEALETALIERLDALVDADIEAISTAHEGAIAYFLRSSIMDDDPLDRALTALSRLAQSGDSPAAIAVTRARTRWAEALRPHTVDRAALDLVMLVGDGLYFNNALDAAGMPGQVPTGTGLDALIDRVLAATQASVPTL